MWGDRIAVKSNLPSPFPEALLALGEAALDSFSGLFGMCIAPEYASKKIRVHANVSATGPLGLWLSPWFSPVEMHMVVAAESELGPPEPVSAADEYLRTARFDSHFPGFPAKDSAALLAI